MSALSDEPGKFTQRAILVVAVVGGLLSVASIYSGYRKIQQAAQSRQAATPSLETLVRPAPDFRLTDQEGRPVSLADLRGRVWAASFVFTHCQGPCPMITGHMAELQSKTADLPDVRLVSFSIDPVRDTPEVLRRYGARFKADGNRWQFLTGPEDEMKRVVQGGFLTAWQPVPDSDQVIHGTMVALVDRKGMIRGFLSGTDPGLAARAAERLRQLHQEKP
ncbi:MAG: SCO family protein [Candidatus Methylacidiphilales bacterium]|nr:SCO family protein [Candidatus Methylacidiphilales bacterium]